MVVSHDITCRDSSMNLDLFSSSRSCAKRSRGRGRDALDPGTVRIGRPEDATCLVAKKRNLSGVYCDAYSQSFHTPSFSEIHLSAASSCSISSISTNIAMVPTWLVVKFMRVRAL